MSEHFFCLIIQLNNSGIVLNQPGQTRQGQQLVSLINYLVQAGETSDAEAFVRELAQRLPQHEDELMTIAQPLEQKGIEKGIEKGILLGEQRGIEKGKLEVARTMLQNGLDRNTIIKLTGLTADELAKIRH